MSHYYEIVLFSGSINVMCHNDDDDNDVHMKVFLNLTPLGEFMFHNLYIFI